MQRCLAWGLATLSIVHWLPVQARDEPLPAMSCQIEGVLRIAGAGALTGTQMLDGCAERIVIAPASPAEYAEPRNLRIAPELPQAVPILTVAGNTTVARIAPKVQEPLDLTGGDAVASADDILRMRPISYTTPYDGMIGRVAERHRIDPLLLHAVIAQESRYRERAVSPVGARGLMQLMPATARTLGIGGGAIGHAESNVDGGARLLRRLYGRYNDFALTLAAYNAGEGAVARYGNQIPPYRETQSYVQKVLAHYRQLAAEQQAAR
jgi:Transglycosylase SLT domain